MELSQLKNIWESANSQLDEEFRMSKEEFRVSIRKRSNTVISKVKRIMKFKIIMGTICIFLLLFVGINLDWREVGDEFILGVPLSNPELLILYGFLAVLVLLLSLYNLFSYRKIIAYQRSSFDLKKSLSEIIAVIKNIIQLGIITDVIGMTCIAFFLLYIQLYKYQTIQSDYPMLIILLGTLITPFFVYRLTKFLQFRKYGNYLQALETYRDELEENPPKM